MFHYISAYDELFPACQPKNKETITTATNYIQVRMYTCTVAHMSNVILVGCYSYYG